MEIKARLAVCSGMDKKNYFQCMNRQSGPEID